jgi:NAD(P)-dependent dehydrogenase (short-subunit alcohol dehydrogenase family)
MSPSNASVPSIFNLTGRKALVTGAARGIGKVLALALAEAGCDVAVLGLHQDTLDEVAKEVRQTGRRSVAVQADVRRKEDVQRALAATVTALGGLDICVNNAGICIHESAEEMPEEHWDRVVDTNLKGVFLCCQAAAQAMIPQKRGSIINIASMSGIVANVPQKQSHYNASKGGVRMLTRSLAVEWAPYGVRVNSICPGYIKTDLTLMAARMFAQWEALTPMGRLGEPDELRGAVVFLASDASSYMTGQDLVIDGGYTAR